MKYEGGVRYNTIDQRESALTYISSVFHRSAASAFLRVCSRCHGDDRPPGHSWCLLSAVADALDLRHRLPVGRYDGLYQWIFSDVHGDLGLSAPTACRGCVAGGWRAPWSSPSEPGHATRVWGSSLHLEFGSNLTRGKTETHIRHNKLNRTTPAQQTPHLVWQVWRRFSV